MSPQIDIAQLRDELQNKYKSLNDSLWEGKAHWPHVERWLANFSDEPKSDADELQLLFLASHFMYFGLREIRGLLRALFRDHVQYKLIQEIRRAEGGTRDKALVENRLRQALEKTRFLGVGNPSESGSHLLYYFRQENGLGKNYFINTHEIFTQHRQGPRIVSKLRSPQVERYVFIDDLCGSGTQAAQYSRDVVAPLKRMNRRVEVSYLPLFATSEGLREVRKLRTFDVVDCAVELDDSFRCFAPNSRVYKNEISPFDRAKTEEICRRYGKQLWLDHPLGWHNGQLLIGFCHNTPDNTLPVIWHQEPSGRPWTPLFRRFPKHYGWQQ